MRAAVVLPGARFGPHAPLLMYASAAAEARSADVHPVWWTGLDKLRATESAAVGAWVSEQASRALDGLGGQGSGTKPLIIGKSLGSYAAALAAQRGLPAVWLTPDLASDWVVDALRQASAPFLLVGGTADDVWAGGLAHELSPHVVEVPDADHSMMVPGPLAASAAVLGEVATAVERFLDEAVWPPAGA
jgi:hypothetical protein